jgi:RNA polymerase sigma-70 factor (ECF subfamily)
MTFARAQHAPGRFPTTRWSLILDAQHHEPARERALQELLARYWKPVYCYVRRRGLSADAAQDAVQGLFTQLLERDFLRRLDPTRGSLRSFLRKAADHYLINQYAQRTAKKRGGELRLVALDPRLAEELLAASPVDPGLAFDREWALGVMERALARLRTEYESGQRRGNVDTVLAFFGLGEVRSYAQAAAECGMTASQFKAALHRARARFRNILNEEVDETVEGGGEMELRRLFEALAC